MSGAESFSFPSYRNLCQYLGEMDAMVELTELAARSFLESATSSGDIEAYIRQLSAKHKICVNLSEVNLLSRHLARSYIVTVYHSAERFLHEFRSEHTALFQRIWTGDAKDVDPLTVTLMNVATSQSETERKIGLDLISRFQYYRAVRNWIVHTKNPDPGRPESTFSQIAEYSEEHLVLFESVKAPNRPGDLSFDDFVFFSRLTKLIAQKLCRIAKPDHSHWVRTFSLKPFKHLQNNKKHRMRNAVAGRIRTEYGMDKRTAEWIADELCGSQA